MATSSAVQYNTRSASVRRLMQEAKELSEPTHMFFACPLEENLFEWHFTVRGPADSDFAGGIYHGRILFPPEYPMKPPNVILLTPNGRFELSKKICLSISGYHPETWLPSWSVRTALLALIGFMPTAGGGAIGSLSYPKEERQKLAKQSVNWRCKECGAVMKDVLSPLGEGSEQTEKEARALASPAGEENAAAGDGGETGGDGSGDSSPVTEFTPEDSATEDEVDVPTDENAPAGADDSAAPASPDSGMSSAPRPSQPDYLALLVYTPLLLICLTLFFGLAYRRLYLV